MPPAEGRGPQDHRQKAFPPCWPQAVSPELSSQPPPSTPEEVAEEAHRLLGDGPRCGASGPSPALPACGVLHRGEVGTGVLHRAEVAWAAAQGVARGVARPRPGGRAGGWSSCCPRRWPPPQCPSGIVLLLSRPPGTRADPTPARGRGCGPQGWDELPHAGFSLRPQLPHRQVWPAAARSFPEGLCSCGLCLVS